MAQNPLGGFLKGLFGRQTPNPAPPASEPAPHGMAPLARPAKRAPRPVPQTEAYQKRNKGRKTVHGTHEGVEQLLAAIQRRGEALPGDLAVELGVARSSLAYNLNKLVAKGCIERLGGGRSIRYRATGKAYTRWGK